MQTFLIHHTHSAAECWVAAATQAGDPAPLRGHCTASAMPHAEHETWWRVEAPGRADALALLPRWIAARAVARPR